MLSLQCSFEYAWWACLYDKETASNVNYLLSCFGKICSKLLAYVRLFNVVFYYAFLDRQFHAKINVDNRFQLWIALDCFVSVMWMDRRLKWTYCCWVEKPQATPARGDGICNWNIIMGWKIKSQRAHGTFAVNFIVAEDIGSFPQREEFLVIAESLGWIPWQNSGWTENSEKVYLNKTEFSPRIELLETLLTKQVTIVY